MTRLELEQKLDELGRLDAVAAVVGVIRYVVANVRNDT
jgi:hypothetical protein